VPLYVFGIAGALAAAGLAYEVLAVKPASDALAVTHQYEYDAAIDRYHDRRTVAIALFGGAAVTAAIGVVLRVVLDREPPLRIQAEAGHGGAAVFVEWSR
jgi:hypothetical protein